MRHPVLALLCCTALASLAEAQYQASNRTARRFGLSYSELSSSLPSTLTLEGPMTAGGLAYAFFVEGPGTPDVAYSLPFLSLEPLSLDLGLAVNLTGALPPSGNQTITFGPTFAPPGTPLEFQMIAPDPLSPSGWAISNGVRRLATGTLPALSAYTANVPSPFSGSFFANDYVDIEQADVDADGDVDTLLLGCDGSLSVMATTGDAFDDTTIWSGFAVAGTSAELADFNNDNYYDLIVSSNSILGVELYENLGRGPSVGGQLGPWLGFQQLPFFSAVAFDSTIPDAPTALDVETADVDGDGWIDFVLACALDPDVGVENRLLANTSAGGGGAISFTEITRTALNPTPFQDDTEDVEFYDLDGDLDLDIVFANVEGPPAITGIDYVYLNAGGVFAGPMTITTPAVADPTLDVVVGDLNGDGAPDIYAANFLDPFGAAAPDQLYLTTGGVPLSWTVSSALLPDNPLYAGTSAVPPVPAVDAEILDADRSAATPEVLVSSGQKCGSLAPGAAGMRYLVGFGAGAPFESFPTGLYIPSVVQTVEVNDIETGDWELEFPDLDVGLATTDDSLTVFGMIYLTK